MAFRLLSPSAMAEEHTPGEPRERGITPIRWCGDLRAVLDGGPFDADASGEEAQPGSAASKPAAA